MQLAMAAGASTGARASGPATAALSPLVGDLEPSLWLCGPGSGALPDGGNGAAATADCYWCQAFGSMPEPAAPPNVLPNFVVAVLVNQPFTAPGHVVPGLPNTGFWSRAPPL